MAVQPCMASNNTIKHTALRMQSHTVALDLYVNSIARGVLCMSQSIDGFGERKHMQWNRSLQQLHLLCVLATLECWTMRSSQKCVTRD